MSIDREEARTWSKERVREEIADLRRTIAEEHDEIHYCQSEIDSIESGEDPRARSDDPDKHLDPLSDAIEKAYRRIDEAEANIEFLKSLL